MIYTVRVDGVSIYDMSEDLALLSPELRMEINTAGSFEFKMPRSHAQYDTPKPLSSDIEVYENDELLWFGRVIETDRDFFNNKTVYCEGAYVFFNDSIQRPIIFDSTTIHEFFRYLIKEHNKYVSANRRFEVGRITVDDGIIYRELNYETTFDVLNKMCLDAEGGYFFIRKEDGINYIDWLSDMPYIGVQPVQFALNMIDISQHIDGSKICTAILPLGAEIDGSRITIAEINTGIDYLASSYAEDFGIIMQVVEFDDIYLPEELKTAAQKWLDKLDMDPLTISCDAAELSYIDPSYPPFRVGQQVQVTSLPNGVDKIFPLTALTISLDSATKKVTLGTPEKRELTKIYKPN